MELHHQPKATTDDAVIYGRRLNLNWLPTSGFENIMEGYEGWERWVDIGRHLVMPASALGLFYLALYTRVMRASML